MSDATLEERVTTLEELVAELRHNTATRDDFF